MPQAGRGDWGRGGVPRTPTPPGPPYLSASRPLKYAWTYSVKAVATGSASWEPSTTGLGPRDSPGETNRLRAWMGPPPHDPLSSPPRTHRAPAGTRRRSPARPGWRAPSARGHSSRRARGSASVTAKQDGIGGGVPGSGPHHGGPAAQPSSPPPPLQPRTRSVLLPAAGPAAGLFVRERRGGATSGTSRGVALGRAGRASARGGGAQMQGEERPTMARLPQGGSNRVSSVP